MKRWKWPKRLTFGLGTGVAIACVDNVAFKGEVSPIVIVMLLLAATITAASIWGRESWLIAAVVWICVPFTHFIKHILRLPDTLHPNTYTSILMVAAFTFMVAALGTAAGMLIHKTSRRGDAA